MVIRPTWRPTEGFAAPLGGWGEGAGLCVDANSRETHKSPHQTMAVLPDVPSHPFLTGDSSLDVLEPRELRLRCWNSAASTPDSETPLPVQARWRPLSENPVAPSPCGQTGENCGPRPVS